VDPRGPRALQGRAGTAVQYAIAVHPANGLVACVKSQGHFTRPLQRDGGRESGVGAQHPGAGSARRIRVEVDDLTGRMHAAVGAPGADRDHRFAGDEGERRLHRILDRRRVLLRLPARVFGAVILDEGGDAAAGIRHVSRAEFRSAAALPVSDWRNLPARLPRECCEPLRDRPCPCTPGQIELGSHFAHGHRFQFRQREIVRRDLGGAGGVRRDRLEFVGRDLGLARRLAHVEIDAAAALAGLEYFGGEDLIFGARLLDGIAAAQRGRKPIQIQVDAVAAEAAQLRGRIDIGLLVVRDIGKLRGREARCRIGVEVRGICTVGDDSGPSMAVLASSLSDPRSAMNDASNSLSSSVRSLSRARLSASAIMRRDFSSRPATMVGASEG